MEFLMWTVAAGFIVWFVQGVLKKLSYCSATERLMRAEGVDIKLMEQVLGAKAYIKMLHYSQHRGWAPGEAAERIIMVYRQKMEASFSDSDKEMFDRFGI